MVNVWLKSCHNIVLYSGSYESGRRLFNDEQQGRIARQKFKLKRDSSSISILKK